MFFWQRCCLNKFVLLGALIIGVLTGLVLHKQIIQPIPVLADGGVYRGTVKDGVLQGEGEIHWAHGGYYRGEFKEGVFSGRGHLKMADGSEYFGQFGRGEFSGQGELRYANGDTYIGSFKRGSFNGQGRYVQKDSVYSGEFVDDELRGEGEHTVSGELVYKGGFRNWLYHGAGQFFSAGQSWKGAFVDGQLSGDGEHNDGDGERYVGAFLNWRYQGNGILYYAGGDRYEGEFRQGQPNGEGVMYLAEEAHGVKQYSGRWQNGRVVHAQPDAFIDRYSEKLEAALYSEEQRLQQQLSTIADHTLGVTDVYFLGVAGDGTQRVFGREMKYISDKIDSRFHNKDKSVVLINDRTQIGDVVMATRTSLEKSVQAIANKMDKDEDVLLIYMTSHGSSDHRFVIKQKGITLPQIEADDLAQILQNSGIKWQMVMISACYSGGFIPALQADTRMIITSAAADRTSFGCSDESDFTYFGKAFFAESFTQQDSWQTIFKNATTWIEARESEEDLTPSKPQMVVGPKMSHKLKELAVSEFHGKQ